MPTEPDLNSIKDNINPQKLFIMKKVILFFFFITLFCVSLQASLKKVGIFYTDHKVPILVNFEDSMLVSSYIEYLSDVTTDNQGRDVVYSNEIIINSKTSLDKVLTIHTNNIISVDTIFLKENLGCFVVKIKTDNIHETYSNLQQNIGCNDIQINRYIFTSQEDNVKNRQSYDSEDYTDEQWGLINTEYPNYDINIEKAWNITKGEGVRIAVIDDGVDLVHEDLYANLLPGFDAIKMEYGNTSGACEFGDAHGTFCAGIIGAMENDYGITGVAPQAKMIPIRGVLKILDQTVTSTEYLLRSLIYAIDNEVHVVNCSWTDIGDFSIINDYLLDTNSKTILVFASGNGNLPTIANPANQDFALTVGAISPCGERTLSASCGIQSVTGSNYGPELELVAPGVDIRTTRPYDTYFINSGSSFACPHVAGVVALMLSVNPDLTREEVHKIICRTAYKLPNYTFTNDATHPYGSWNEEVGYGLVDAGAAVFRALSKRISISGPDDVCQSSRYYLENLPDSSRVIWGFTKPNNSLGGVDFNFNDTLPPVIDATITRPFSINGVMLDTVTITQGGSWSPIQGIDSTWEPYVGNATLWAGANYMGDTIWRAKQIYIQEKLDPEIQANISFFPDMEEDAPEHLLVGVSYYFKSALFPNENDLQWTIVMTGDTVTGVGIQSPIITAGYDSIFVSVFNPNTDECISNSLSTKLYTTMEFIGMDFANPADDMVDIQVAHTLPSNTQARNMTLRTANIEPLLYRGECEIELWDMYRGKLRTVTGKDGYVQMPLQGVAPGNYVLSLIIDGQQVDSKPLMVR